MKQSILIIVIGLFALFIQGALLHCGLPPYLMPQLLVLIAVYLAFHEVTVGAAFAVFFFGLLLDFSSAILVGPWAGALVAVYGVLALLSQRLFIESGLVAMFTAFFASLAANIIYLALAFEYREAGSSFLWEALGQAFATALLAPVVVSLLSRWLRRKPIAALGRALAA